MRPPPDRRKAPPVEGGAFQIDRTSKCFGQPKYNPDSPFRQGNYSYISLPNLTAVARRFGCLGALYVIYPDGSERRLGLFEDKHDAALVTRAVNKLLAMGVRHD